ncbi:MAG: DUF4091 domain-containing protein [Candidatus Schekmanbacteria bacterium]|nr:DUF4091 domain-containing protein [Candidatus Schekmanbacteria bacterium]
MTGANRAQSANPRRSFRSNLRALAALLLWLPAGACEAAPESAATAPSAWATHALVKIRPHDTAAGANGAATIELQAARNEFEPFQVVLEGGSTGLTDVDAVPTDLRSAAGATIERRHVRVYCERMIELQKPSSQEGEAGPWPDALVPRRDVYEDEPRNAFPLDVGQGVRQPLWIEVYVPAEAAADRYSGTLQISRSGRDWQTIGITLQVRSFALPSTASLPTTFGFSGLSALRQHLGGYTSDEDLLWITKLYAKAALLHRLSIHGGTMTPPRFSPEGAGGSVEWTNYDAEVGPFLDGAALGPRDPLPGARATSVDLRAPAGLESDAQKVAYWREWARHFRERGWFERLFHYVWDEPTAEMLPAVAARARLAHQADPQIRNLVTAPLHASLVALIDVWAPLINCFELKDNEPYCILAPVPRSGYEDRLRQGDDLWWYQACGSHGCDIVGGSYFAGWPSYVIDVSPVANRIMEWVTWKYGIRGELYFAMNEAYATAPDPWESVFAHGGNGDGTLFYPGLPGRIGGTTHIPIESIRLKLIREGLEDYEYLAMLAAHGARQVADREVGAIVASAFRWESDPAALYAARRRLGDELERVLGSAPAPGKP